MLRTPSLKFDSFVPTHVALRVPLPRSGPQFCLRARLRTAIAGLRFKPHSSRPPFVRFVTFCSTFRDLHGFPNFRRDHAMKKQNPRRLSSQFACGRLADSAVASYPSAPLATPHDPC